MSIKKKKQPKTPSLQKQIEELKKAIEELKQRQPVVINYPQYPAYPNTYPSRYPLPWSPIWYSLEF